MPKINSKVNTRDQQQRLRRMRQREVDFAEKFSENNINCVSLCNLYRASKDELMALIPIIKKIIQHNLKTAELISERCYTPEEISTDDYNTELYEHLSDTYKGIKGKTLKYTYCHQRDRFRQTIIGENQLQFNNCLPISVENTITKLFKDIDISDYIVTDTYLKNEAKAREAQREAQRETQRETQTEIIIPEAPLPPTPTPEMLTPNQPSKKKAASPKKKAASPKKKAAAAEPAEPAEPAPAEHKKKASPAPAEPAEPAEPAHKKKKAAEPAAVYESDSDIEEDIKELEIRDTTDQDDNTPDDLKRWRTKISKLWKNEIEEQFNNIEDDEDDYDEYSKGVNINSDTKRLNNKLKAKYENEIPSIIHIYINRTKTQNRGKKSEVGAWSMRNPVSLKKIITSIVVCAQRKILKENL